MGRNSFQQISIGDWQSRKEWSSGKLLEVEVDVWVIYKEIGKKYMQVCSHVFGL